ncbi:MAG: threonine synthase [Candidatus Scalindua sp. AMX11]|nr:MAG: threonine synthase [Candidatus Scalindua sp.]NOG82302.1 threonine synthase [Planctomycetota bacterium]RZV66660.1 MAG: threonine synthase [Candidatus Scalindua sp. SCAELEC01]TDE63637.1 MAG: threonine synthase [Candidatus Scalindua sp. AMX11]GJQ60004.1 MAG: threonine synthase [Candidatus Scalindua sp.]
MGFVKGLKCRECGKEYPKEPLHVCSFCFGPLEVDYEYDEIKKVISRELIEARKPTMWRYKELLPLDSEPTVGVQVGFTPLVKADNLAKKLGVDELYVKNDSVNFPTFSFKDRVVSAALSKAKEFGFKTVACATTGNLGNSVAAQAVQGNLESYIIMPANLEQGKVLGTSIYGTNVIGINGGNYDGVNRLCSEIADKYGWAFANINIRPFYAEGSKTYGYEIVEQLGWKAPKHVVVPMAGGSLIIKIGKAVKEFEKLGLINDSDTKLYGAQASGSSPISTAVKNGSEFIKPVKPDTIAHSIAIGNPADGHYSIKAIHNSGGWAEDVTDEELVEGIKLLASTEGIFTETAGGVTVAVTKKLLEQERIPRDESIVICITGNGLKTQEAVLGKVDDPSIIMPTLEDFEAFMERKACCAA